MDKFDLAKFACKKYIEKKGYEPTNMFIHKTLFLLYVFWMDYLDESEKEITELFDNPKFYAGGRFSGATECDFLRKEQEIIRCSYDFDDESFKNSLDKETFDFIENIIFRTIISNPFALADITFEIISEVYSTSGKHIFTKKDYMSFYKSSFKP